MAEKKYKVAGLGELLWDLFPSGKKLGGAPANFAYIASVLGDEGVPVSSLGSDDLGRAALHRLQELNLCADYIQLDDKHRTGTVQVTLDSSGQPCFQIAESVAWDFLSWTPEWQKLAAAVDAVSFGSLAQRSAPSRSSILNFVKATAPQALRIFDVNLRQHFFTAEIIAESLKLAMLVKMNHEELPRIMRLLGLEAGDEESSARCLLRSFDLQLICITRGNRGSLLVSPEATHSHAGFQVRVADTVGAGDAFTAGLVHEYLRGSSLERVNEAGNRVGAWVASEAGATPVVERGSLEQTLRKVG